MKGRKSEAWILLVAICLFSGVLGVAQQLYAYPMYLTEYNNTFGTSESCSLCHATNPPSKQLTPTGTKFKNGGFNVCSIAPTPGPCPPPPPQSDTTPPTVTSFNIPPTSNSLAVSIASFSASDNIGVTGYAITESGTPPAVSDSGWKTSAPSQYQFGTEGKKTLYAWAKDAAGNVSSSLSATTTISLTAPPPPPPSPPQGDEPDLTDWVGKWFRVTEKAKGYRYARPQLSKTSAGHTGYLKFWEWDPLNSVLKGDRYEQDAQSGQWVSEPFDLHYLAGSDIDFLCWSEVSGNMTVLFTARVQGKKKGDMLQRASLKSMGGYYMEKSAGDVSPEYWTGGLSVTGTLVPASSVPVPEGVLAH